MEIKPISSQINKWESPNEEKDMYDLDLEIKEDLSQESSSKTGGGTRTHCSAVCKSAACGTAGATCRGTCQSCGATCMGTCINCRAGDIF